MMIINNKVYDQLKWIALILLPGTATLYLALGQIWGWPYGNEVSGTIMAIDTFLGMMLGISTANYRASGVGTDGVLVVDKQENELYLAANKEPKELAKQDEVVFKTESH